MKNLFGIKNINSHSEQSEESLTAPFCKGSFGNFPQDDRGKCIITPPEFLSSQSSLRNSTLPVQGGRINKNHPLPPAGTSPIKGADKAFKNAGFTLAEVLITLGIIGVVAAMTIPNMITKFDQQRTALKLKKYYSIIAQATRQSTAENEEVSGWDFTLPVDQFFDTYYAPVLKTLHRTKKNNKLYIVLMDGTCAYLRTNGNPSGDISAYYWGIDTMCGKGPQMEGVTLFELNLYNYVDSLVFCATSARPCVWKTDANYNGTWRKHFLDDSKFKSYCRKGSMSYGWKGYECYLKFVHDGFKFSKNYDYAKVKRSYGPSYSKPLSESNNYWYK